MLYTTTTKVREVSGFVGNTNVSDAFITNIITRIQGLIDGAVGEVYTLPLPTFYKNSITFSGTGGASVASMTITIDSVAYVVSITNGMTASQAADAFRVLFDADTSKDFEVIDETGQGSIITIVTNSQDGLRADVTVSQGTQTVNSLVATVGGIYGAPASLIEGIATCLAAAKLLITEYGAEAQDTDKDGHKLLEECMDMLDQVRNKKLKIYDYIGSPLPYSDTGTIDFYPNTASETDPDTLTSPKFTINKQF